MEEYLHPCALVIAKPNLSHVYFLQVRPPLKNCIGRFVISNSASRITVPTAAKRNQPPAPGQDRSATTEEKGKFTAIYFSISLVMLNLVFFLFL